MEIKQSFNRLINFINWLYIQYSLVTALNILDKFERVIFNCTLISILFICTYSTYVYLPQQIRSISSVLYNIYNQNVSS